MYLNAFLFVHLFVVSLIYFTQKISFLHLQSRCPSVLCFVRLPVNSQRIQYALAGWLCVLASTHNGYFAAQLISFLILVLCSSAPTSCFGMNWNAVRFEGMRIKAETGSMDDMKGGKPLQIGYFFLLRSEKQWAVLHKRKETVITSFSPTTVHWLGLSRAEANQLFSSLAFWSARFDLYVYQEVET